MNKKRNFAISILLILIAVVFTILVKVVDVKSVGANGTDIGFATINTFVFNKIGTHMSLYNITEILGFVAIFTVVIYAIIGIVQLIRRKSLLKVDREIIALGIYYVAIIALYLFFEKVIFNYRPILIDGQLEASYPSSHTLMSICLCGGAILINKKLFNNKFTKFANILLVIIGATVIIGRLISGVHWFTDIIGGIIISGAMLMTFYSVLVSLKKKIK